MKYLRYLESVQEATGDEYTEISGLLDRYKTLTDAHADLEGRQRETMVHTEAQKARVTVLRQVGPSSTFRRGFSTRFGHTSVSH